MLALTMLALALLALAALLAGLILLAGRTTALGLAAGRSLLALFALGAIVLFVSLHAFTVFIFFATILLAGLIRGLSHGARFLSVR